MSFKKILTRPLLFTVVSLWFDLFILVDRWTFRRLHRFDYCLYHIILLIDLLYVNRSFQFCFSTWTRHVIPYLRQCIGFSSNHTQALFILLFFPCFLFSHYSTSTHSTSKASSGATRKKKQNKTHRHSHTQRRKKKKELCNTLSMGVITWGAQAGGCEVLRMTWRRRQYCLSSVGIINDISIIHLETVFCFVLLQYDLPCDEQRRKLLSSGFVYDCSSFFYRLKRYINIYRCLLLMLSVFRFYK